MTRAPTGAVIAVAEAVHSGRSRARSVIELALTRIERNNPTLGAVVALRADEALREADALDDLIAAGSRDPGLLAGVPVLVKDSEDIAGMRTTHGSALFVDAPIALGDGTIPARLRAAGAIVVGKSNMPEFATEGYTDNLLFGPTRNPWGLAWSPGGSSGGSAAAVSAGLVPIATATDGGGSIRIPAAFCGLVGIKPTTGRIGRWPPHDWIDFSTPGPFATTVADLRRLLAVESSPVAGDPASAPFESQWADGRPPNRLFAAHRTSDLGPLPPRLAAQFEAAVRAFADLVGLEAEWREPGSFFTAGDPDLDWFVIATAEHVASLGRERVVAGLDRMHSAARAFLADGLEVGIDEYLEARRRRFEHVRQLDLLLGEAGVLLTPTVALEGWTPDGRTHDGAAGTMLPPSAYSTALQNVTGHPAMTLPAGRSDNGIPFGLQITGPRFGDDLLLRVAERWESAHPWPLVASGYEPFEPPPV